MSFVRDIDFDSACACPRLSLAGWRTWGRVVRVYDGDTATIVVNTPFTARGNSNTRAPEDDPRGVGSELLKFSCRLSGINAPELRSDGVAAIAARNFLIGLVVDKKFDGPLSGRAIEDELRAAECVWVECGKFDKYGRLLTVIYRDPKSETSFNAELVKAGHAVPYMRRGIAF